VCCLRTLALPGAATASSSDATAAFAATLNPAPGWTRTADPVNFSQVSYLLLHWLLMAVSTSELPRIIVGRSICFKKTAFQNLMSLQPPDRIPILHNTLRGWVQHLFLFFRVHLANLPTKTRVAICHKILDPHHIMISRLYILYFKLQFTSHQRILIADFG
jgi:hypothetical protein